MRKVPTIVLSITYKGVKFIDAANKVSYYMHTLPPLCVQQTLRVFRVMLYIKLNSVFFFCDCKCHLCKFMSGLFLLVFPSREQVWSYWHLFDINKKRHWKVALEAQPNITLYGCTLCMAVKHDLCLNVSSLRTVLFINQIFHNAISFMALRSRLIFRLCCDNTIKK